MILSSTPEEISEALRRFDREYRDRPKWSNWTQNRSHSYAIQSGDKLYPVKFVLSLATGQPVSKFRGGDKPGQVAHFVENLGFTIVHLRRRNPPWTRDELILALDLYLRFRESPPGKSSDEIALLSQELNDVGGALGIAKSEDFRNANGTYMKLMNFRRLDPDYTDQGKVGLTRGGKLEEGVWTEFADDPSRCHQVAEAIRAGIDVAPHIDDGDVDDGAEAEEGRLLTAIHRRRERDRKIVKKKKDDVLRRTGKLECEACGFSFKQRYGERGDGFIECHHTRPVSEGAGITRLSDLALLCANCHRMVHAKRPWLSFAELIELIRP